MNRIWFTRNRTVVIIQSVTYSIFRSNLNTSRIISIKMYYSILYKVSCITNCCFLSLCTQWSKIWVISNCSIQCWIKTRKTNKRIICSISTIKKFIISTTCPVNSFFNCLCHTNFITHFPFSIRFNF